MKGKHEQRRPDPQAPPEEIPAELVPQEGVHFGGDAELLPVRYDASRPSSREDPRELPLPLRELVSGAKAEALMPFRERAIQTGVSQRAGRNIRRERLLRMWTLTEFSFRMTEAGYRLSPATLRQVERGTTEGNGSRVRLLTCDEAVAFSEVLEVPVTVLLYRETKWDDTESAGGSGGSSRS